MYQIYQEGDREGDIFCSVLKPDGSFVPVNPICPVEHTCVVLTETPIILTNPTVKYEVVSILLIFISILFGILIGKYFKKKWE